MKKEEQNKNIHEDLLERILNKSLELEKIISAEYDFLNANTCLEKDEESLFNAKAKMLDLQIKVLTVLQTLYKTLQDQKGDEDETEKLLLEIINSDNSTNI